MVVIHEEVTRICMHRGLGSGEQDYLLLYSLARAFQASKMLEVGTYRGASAICLCQAALDNGVSPRLITVESDSARVAEVREMLTRIKFTPYVEVVEGTSVHVLTSILRSEGMFDLIFLDGDHSACGLMTDFLLCCQATKRMLIHDSELVSVCEALTCIKQQGWSVTHFPTRYVEGDKHPVGMALVENVAKL